MPDTCVIFDLDGTLVDSEPLGNQALLDLLPDLDAPVDELVKRYRGLKLSLVLADVEDRLGRKLPERFAADYRLKVAELFDEHLKPMPGVADMLVNLDRPKCIASSGPPEKIAQALNASKLAHYFDGAFYSSYVIGSWKPSPDLFLHAAQDMGFHPDRCIVIEDSVVGVQAALAAGMAVYHYAPPHAARIDGNVQSFHDMTRLPDLLAASGR